MADQPKYIPFPLFLISGLPNNLDEIFDYGIYKFGIGMQPREIGVVYTQVLYAFYRQELPSSIKRKLDLLVRKSLFTPDEDYNGFVGTPGEFHPETGIDELTEAGKQDPEFASDCMQFWQVRQAMSVLKIKGDIGSIIPKALSVQKQVDERARLHKKDVMVMISVKMMFQYYRQSKTDYEFDLLRAFLSIKSILGNKDLVGTTKDFILMRMTGAKNKALLEEVLSVPALKVLHDKYSKRYHMDRLLDELLARGFITGKLAFGRRIYLSTRYSISELPDAVKALLIKNNSKVKRDMNKAEEKRARAKLSEMIKGDEQHLNKVL